MEESSNWLESCKTKNITHTYRRHHWRRKIETGNRNEQEDENGEANVSGDVQVVIGSLISAISPTSFFKSSTTQPYNIWDVHAPETPDIVARYDKAAATDANERSYCKKRTCYRSLNFDDLVFDDVFDDSKRTKDFEANDLGRPPSLLVYRRKAKKSIQSRLISSSTTLPNELQDSTGPNERVTEKLAKPEEDRQKESLDRKIKLFMSRMNDIQGGRKFFEWKGSVMDSIVGAYLAQNVNDAMSGPAFMSLAAKFPKDAARVMLNANENRNNAACRKSVHKGTRGKETKTKHDPALLMVMKDCLSKHQKEKKMSQIDAVDWDSVRAATVKEIAKAIQTRGMNNNLAQRIKDCLEQLVKDFGSTDMEWIRDVPALKAKEYLMGLYGLGLKSVECIRLLTLQHNAFPIDRNAGRVAVRLGWFHLPNEYLKSVSQKKQKSYSKLMDSIQMYLWPHLSHLDCSILYELHCHLITFGKVFCTENNPNCYECPMRADCTHFASVQASAEVQSRGLADVDMEDYGIVRPQTKFHTSESAFIAVVKKRKDVRKNVTSLRTEHQICASGQSRSFGRESLEKDGCIPEDDDNAVYGTFLIPARSATRGTFPLNGTFFQTNEVFADDESSEVPIKVPRASLTDLSLTTLYCGNSTSSICKGMTCDEVQKCYTRGFACFRGLNLKTREPKPLPARFHDQARYKAEKMKNLVKGK